MAPEPGLTELSTLGMGRRNSQGDVATTCEARAGARQQEPPLFMRMGLPDGPKPQHGCPHGATEPGAPPGSPHHGRECSTGVGAGAGQAGGGWQKMNEGVGRLMALSGK